MTDTLDTQTVAAVVERKKLQRHFGRFDILFFLICTIVGVDTIATVAQGGGQAFTWMMIFAVVFFVPQALLFAELGSAFPQEGGPYYWTRLAFGHLAGAVNNFLYWITNPVWIGGTLTISCLGAVEVFFNHGASVATPVWFIIALAFVWLSIIAAITSFSVGKWLPTAGAMARFLLLGLFTITVLIYAAKNGAHGLGASGYRPNASGFVLLVGVLLFILCLLTSGATWIMGSDRALAVSCYDGAGPRPLGVINARYGTPVRVNVLSGIVASIVVVLAHQITSGDAAKYFNAVLGVTISTTLISYLLIYPALWKLRRSHPGTPRPYRMPAYRVLTVLLMILVAVASVQLIAPGLGSSWFGSDFIPEGWTYAQRFTYLWTELIPVLSFVVIGTLFWWLGRRTRAQAAAPELEELS